MLGRDIINILTTSCMIGKRHNDCRTLRFSPLPKPLYWLRIISTRIAVLCTVTVFWITELPEKSNLDHKPIYLVGENNMLLGYEAALIKFNFSNYALEGRSLLKNTFKRELAISCISKNRCLFPWKWEWNSKLGTATELLRSENSKAFGCWISTLVSISISWVTW